MKNRDDGVFLVSVSRYEDLPFFGVPEFGVLGRSNVGKSSFINFMTGRKGLAPVSENPGKTRKISCYRLYDSVWTDLPGYGYAKTSKKRRSMLSDQIRDYFMKSDALCGVIWLLDIRHPYNNNDVMALEWLNTLKLPVLPVFTKCDKLRKRDLSANLGKYMEMFNEKPMYALVSVNQPEKKREFFRVFSKWKDLIAES